MNSLLPDRMATYLKETPYCETASKPCFHTSVTSQEVVAWRRQDRNAEIALPPTKQDLVSRPMMDVIGTLSCWWPARKKLTRQNAQSWRGSHGLNVAGSDGREGPKLKRSGARPSRFTTDKPGWGLGRGAKARSRQLQGLRRGKGEEKIQGEGKQRVLKGSWKGKGSFQSGSSRSASTFFFFFLVFLLSCFRTIVLSAFRFLPLIVAGFQRSWIPHLNPETEILSPDRAGCRREEYRLYLRLWLYGFVLMPITRGVP